MSRRLLVLGSITAVGATASILLFNQNNSPSLISITPSLNNSSTPSSLPKNENALLPSLTKPLISVDKSPLKEAISYSQPIATPTTPLVKSRQFVPSSSVKLSQQKPMPIITKNTTNPVGSRQFLLTQEAQLSSNKLPQVFTHRSRPIVAPIDYPIVPIESLATPTPILETPTLNPQELLVTPAPVPSPINSLATPVPIPTNSSTTLPSPTNSLATPVPIPTNSSTTLPSPTNSLATPVPSPTNASTTLPIQTKPIATPTPNQPKSL